MKTEMLAYIDKRSPIHELTGATKLLCFIMWSTAAMLTYDTRILLVLLAGSLLLFYVSKIKYEEIRFVLLFMLVFLVLNNVAIYVFSPEEGVRIYDSRTVLLSGIGRYTLTYEQLFYQLNITLKYITVIPAALLFIVTTSPSEFASSLNRIGVSYRIAFSVSLALRYIPDIQRDFVTISRAQQAKGIDLSKNEKLTKRIRHASSIVIPLIFSSLDRIETISNVMDLRGFGKNKKRTWYRARPFVKSDWIALSAMAVLLVGSLIITFYDGSRFYNPFH